MKYLLTLVCLFLFACQSPVLVASFTSDGAAHVATDSRKLLAIGNASGEAKVFMKGSGFPVTLPWSVESGQVLLYDLKTKEKITQPLSSPLPSWCEDLFAPGEVEYLSTLFGAQITFEVGDEPEEAAEV